MYKITKENLLYSLSNTTCEEEIKNELYTAYKELISAYPLEPKEINLITAVIENSIGDEIKHCQVGDIPFEATVMLAKLFKERSKYHFETKRARNNCINKAYNFAYDYFKRVSGLKISIKSNWFSTTEELEDYEDRFMSIIMSEAVNPKVINKVVDYYFYYTIKKIFLEYAK
jgi:hypothetical protein